MRRQTQQAGRTFQYNCDSFNSDGSSCVPGEAPAVDHIVLLLCTREDTCVKFGTANLKNEEGTLRSLRPLPLSSNNMWFFSLIINQRRQGNKNIVALLLHVLYHINMKCMRCDEDAR